METLTSLRLRVTRAERDLADAYALSNEPCRPGQIVSAATIREASIREATDRLAEARADLAARTQGSAR